MTDISVLVGKTLSGVENAGNEVTFTSDHGEVWRLYHVPDCCENVRVEDVVGNLADLIGSPILLAQEVSDADEPPPAHEYVDSYTWTFYKLATVKGDVTIRFLGESNGYYSESVDFEVVKGVDVGPRRLTEGET